MVKLACISLLLAVAMEADATDYCKICSDHTMCLYKGIGPACSRHKFRGIDDDSIKQHILELHNKYRRYVAEGKEKRGSPGPQPPASNMAMLEWNDELATIAQRWADQCDFRHDHCRNTDTYHWVGQNLYIAGTWRSNGVVADAKQDWDEAIGGFYNEVRDLNNKNIKKLNSYPNRNQTGHYTQLVWAETTHVGCGYIAYVERNNSKDWYQKYYVCNYGPGGNFVGQRVYEEGATCSKCPTNTSCQSGLCTTPISMPIITALLKPVIKFFHWIIS